MKPDQIPQTQKSAFIRVIRVIRDSDSSSAPAVRQLYTHIRVYMPYTYSPKPSYPENPGSDNSSYVAMSIVGRSECAKSDMFISMYHKLYKD